jgi:hypothetical protein
MLVRKNVAQIDGVAVNEANCWKSSFGIFYADLGQIVPNHTKAKIV